MPFDVDKFLEGGTAVEDQPLSANPPPFDVDRFLAGSEPEPIAPPPPEEEEEPLPREQVLRTPSIADRPVTQPAPRLEDRAKAVLDEQRAPTPQMPRQDLRADGTKKGSGFFGVLDIPGGGKTSEYSIGVNIDGKELEIPTLVPTLTEEEKNLMVNDIIPGNKRVPDAIADKAVEHARSRVSSGLSPFAGDNIEAGISEQLGIPPTLLLNQDYPKRKKGNFIQEHWRELRNIAAGPRAPSEEMTAALDKGYDKFQDFVERTVSFGFDYEGSVDRGKQPNSFQYGAWNTKQDLAYSAAADDRKRLKQLKKIDDRYQQFAPERGDTFVGRSFQGLAGSAPAMMQSIALSPTGIGPSLFWQQQGAGGIMRGYVDDKNIDDISDEDLKRAANISQAWGVPYAAVELAVRSIPGMKGFGSSIDKQVSRVVVSKLMGMSTAQRQAIAQQGVAFMTRWMLETAEEAVQGGIEEIASKQTNRQDIDWDAVRARAGANFKESIGTTFLMTAGGTGGQAITGELQADVRRDAAQIEFKSLEDRAKTLLSDQQLEPSLPAGESQVAEDQVPTEVVETFRGDEAVPSDIAEALETEEESTISQWELDQQKSYLESYKKERDLAEKAGNAESVEFYEGLIEAQESSIRAMEGDLQKAQPIAPLPEDGVVDTTETAEAPVEAVQEPIAPLPDDGQVDTTETAEEQAEVEGETVTATLDDVEDFLVDQNKEATIDRQEDGTFILTNDDTGAQRVIDAERVAEIQQQLSQEAPLTSEKKTDAPTSPATGFEYNARTLRYTFDYEGKRYGTDLQGEEFVEETISGIVPFSGVTKETPRGITKKYKAIKQAFENAKKEFREKQQPLTSEQKVEIQEDAPTLDVVDQMEKNGEMTSDSARIIRETSKFTGRNTPVRFIDGKAENKRGEQTKALGRFFPEKDGPGYIEIYVDNIENKETNPFGKTVSDIVSHEFFHGITIDENNKVRGEKRKELLDIRRIAREQAKKDGKFTDDTFKMALNDNGEFLAELYRDAELREYLKTIPSTKTTTVFDDVVSWIMDLLNIDKSNRTLLTDALEVSTDAIAKDGQLSQEAPLTSEQKVEQSKQGERKDARQEPKTTDKDELAETKPADDGAVPAQETPKAKLGQVEYERRGNGWYKVKTGRRVTGAKTLEKLDKRYQSSLPGNQPVSGKMRTEQQIRDNVDREGLQGEIETFVATLKEAGQRARQGGTGKQLKADSWHLDDGRWFNAGKAYPEGFDGKSVAVVEKFLKGDKSLTQNQLDTMERVVTHIVSELGLGNDIITDFNGDIENGTMPPAQVIAENQAEWKQALKEAGKKESELTPWEAGEFETLSESDKAFLDAIEDVFPEADAQVAEEAQEEPKSKAKAVDPRTGQEEFIDQDEGGFQLVVEKQQVKETFEEKQAREKKQREALEATPEFDAIKTPKKVSERKKAKPSEKIQPKEETTKPATPQKTSVTNKELIEFREKNNVSLDDTLYGNQYSSYAGIMINGEEVGQGAIGRTPAEAKAFANTVILHMAKGDWAAAKEDAKALDVEKAKELLGVQGVDLTPETEAKPVGLMNKSELQDRADQLGIKYSKKETSKKELQRLVLKSQKGGFIDVGVERKQEDWQNAPFAKQVKEVDKKALDYEKSQKRSIARVLDSQLIDRTGDVKKGLESVGGDEVIQKMVLASGSSAQSNLLFQDFERSIKKVLPKSQYELLKTYLIAMRTIEATAVQEGRGVELKSPTDVNDAKEFINNTFENLPTEQKDAVKEAAEVFWGAMRGQLDALLDAGLISKEAHAEVVANHKFYAPRLFIEFIDPVSTSPNGERTHDSGVKALGEGKESGMVQDPSYLAAHIFSRTQNRVFQNRANRALYDLAEEGGTEGVVRVLKSWTKGDKTAPSEDQLTFDIDEVAESPNVTRVFEQPKRNEGIVRVFIDGQEARMAMPAVMADQWNGTNPALNEVAAKILRYGSGTALLKALATGVNPEFAISNLPRDAAYAWFNTQEYSPLLPAAAIQMGTDYVQITKDAITRGPRYREYIREGGGMDFLSNQGIGKKNILKGATGNIRKLAEILAWLGETSEIATRLAVRERAIKNGRTSEEATFIARNMLDFLQGGSFSKAADNAIPYLNAAMQGTRGGFRAFKTAPVQTTAKAAQIVAIGYGMARMVATLAPALWASLDDREKATKWIIPLPWTKTDRNGNERHAYIAIPKDQFQQTFAAMGQSMVDAMAGRPWKKQVMQSIQSIMPIDSSTDVPIRAAWMAYFRNYDNWTQEDVWRGYKDISPSNEVSWRTPEIAQDVSALAKQAGIEISPERLATATTKILPNSNPLGPLLSSAYSVANEDDKIAKTAVEKIREVPGLRRMLRFSRPTEVLPRTAVEAKSLKVDVEGMTDRQAREAIREAKVKRADERQPLNTELDRFIQLEQRTPQEVREWLSENADTAAERQRLWNRARTAKPDLYKGPYRRSRSRSRRSRRR